jgi:FOG: Ankyrin repeat
MESFAEEQVKYLDIASFVIWIPIVFFQFLVGFKGRQWVLNNLKKRGFELEAKIEAHTKDSVVTELTKIKKKLLIDEKSINENDEERFYTIVANELESNTIQAGLWTKCFALSDGDEKLTRAKYIQMRVEQLRDKARKRLEADKELLRAVVTMGSLSEDKFLSVIKEAFIKRKMNVNEMLPCGNAALHIACQMGYKEAVKLLLSLGADKSLQNKKGWTPIEYAKVCNQGEILQMLTCDQS